MFLIDRLNIQSLLPAQLPRLQCSLYISWKLIETKLGAKFLREVSASNNKSSSFLTSSQGLSQDKRNIEVSPWILSRCWWKAWETYHCLSAYQSFILFNSSSALRFSILLICHYPDTHTFVSELLPTFKELLLKHTWKLRCCCLCGVSPETKVRRPAQWTFELTAYLWENNSPWNCISIWHIGIMDFRWCSKESTCQCRRHKRRGFNPWGGKIRWRMN